MRYVKTTKSNSLLWNFGILKVEVITFWFETSRIKNFVRYQPKHLPGKSHSLFHCVKSVQIQSYFWSVFSYIRTEYRKKRTINNSVFGHFSSSILSKWLDTWQSPKNTFESISLSRLEYSFFHGGVSYHIETNPLISKANQWTGFFMIRTSVMKVLNSH